VGGKRIPGVRSTHTLLHSRMWVWRVASEVVANAGGGESGGSKPQGLKQVKYQGKRLRVELYSKKEKACS